MAADQRVMRALLLIQLISMGAMEMSGPFWPLHIQTLLGSHHQAYSGLFAGLVYAGPMLTAMMFTHCWGRLGDRVGHKLMIVRALIALAICQSLAGLVTDPWLLIVTRMAQGGLAGFLAAAQAYALSLNLQNRQGRTIAKLQSATAAGSLAGPVLGGWLMEFYSFAVLCHLSAVLCVSCALVSLKLPDTTARFRSAHRPETPLPSGWIGALLLIIVLIQAAKVMPQPFYALYVTQVLHATPSLIGITYALSAASLALTAPLWGRLFDQWQPPRVLQVIEWVTWLSALTVAVGALANEWLTFVVSRLLWGVWQGALLPVAYALIASTLPQPRHGFALGLGNSAAKAGALAGVLIGGIGMSLMGLPNSFWLVALTYIIAALAVRAIRATHCAGICLPYSSTPGKTQQ